MSGTEAKIKDKIVWLTR